ncbi:E3 ubiquitin-protein ligase pub1 [Strongylocentrotus purpuratus]|uniref:HECT-type E3 ubiquitin transferase n=1 Tax=Strongylocentrotus purpuratus TaxID=7668 RepID=A0A7M7NP14_STRPU|nr:E3 ubiquitin-protein ligase pub1 [Strongylocentrotus purpuratus]
MAKGMQTLIEASDDDLFDYRFTVDGPVNELEIELKPGGKDVVVTTANVREYIKLYARHYTASSQFDVFSESFRSMFGRFGLHQRFAPQELALVMRKATQQTIVWSRCFGVLTGANHVPIGGFQEISPRMWPMGGDQDCRGEPPKDMCPEVNTCHGFIVLHLPMYRKREHLKERLM